MSKDNYPLNTEPMQFRQDKAGPVGGAGELTALVELLHKRLDVFEIAAKNHLYQRDVLSVVAAVRPIVDELAALAAKAPQGVDSQTICRKLDAVALHLNLKGRPQSLDIATAVRLVEEGAEWAAKHIEERGRELDKLRATLNKVAKDIDGDSPNGESIARERIQSVLREAAAPKPAPPPERIAGPCDAEGLAEQYWHGGRRIALDEWVNERIENCNRIAAQKEHEDKEHWLEDAWYYEQIRQVLSQQNSTFAGPAPGAERTAPTWDNLPERDRFEKWWQDATLDDVGEMLDEFDLHEQALIAGFAKRVWREALAAAPPPPANDHELLVGGVVRVALELAILRGDLRMDNGAAFEEMSESEREDVISDTWMAMHGEGTCEGGLVKELKAIYAALGRDRHASAERVRQLHGLVETLANSYKGVLPYDLFGNDANLDADTRTRLALIADVLKQADVLAGALPPSTGEKQP